MPCWGPALVSVQRPVSLALWLWHWHGIQPADARQGNDELLLNDTKEGCIWLSNLPVPVD